MRSTLAFSGVEFYIPNSDHKLLLQKQCIFSINRAIETKLWNVMFCSRLWMIVTHFKNRHS